MGRANSSVEMAREEGLNSGGTSEVSSRIGCGGELIGCGEGSVVGGLEIKLHRGLYLYLLGTDLF